jgi:hypothetical protein
MTEQGPAQLEVDETDRRFPFVLLPAITYSQPDPSLEVRDRDAIDRRGLAPRRPVRSIPND